MLEWYYNAKTGEIGSYNINGETNDFPRGTFLAYGDYLTTGLDSREAAVRWAQEWSACPKCKAVRKGKHGDACICGTSLENKFRADIITDEHLDFLDGLRESAQINMFEAPRYLRESYPELSKDQVMTIFNYWKDTFGSRHADRTAEKEKE